MFFDSSPTHHSLKSRLARLLTYSSTLRKAPFETKTTCFTFQNLCVSTLTTMYWRTKTTCFAHHCILAPLFGVLIWGFNAPVW